MDKSQEEAINDLVDILGDGGIIYPLLRSKSKSGMQRVISFHTVYRGGIIHLNRLIGEALGYKHSRARDGLVIRGCGMDLGYHVASQLEHVLGIKVGHIWL